MSEQLPEWAASLPEPLQSAPYLKEAASPEAFVEQVKNAAAWQGNSIRLPGPDASPESMKEFHDRMMEKVPGLMPTPNMEDGDSVSAVLSRLGLPETADGYRLPADVDIAGDRLGELKSHALEVGLTQAQFEKQVGLMTKQGEVADTQRQDYLSEQQSIIRNEWGQAYADRMGEIKAFLDNDAPADIKQAFEKSELSAESTRWLYKMAIAGGEPGQFEQQQDGGSGRNMTPDEITEQLSELESRIFAQGANEDPAYQTWVQKRLKLLAMLDPNAAQEIDAWRAAG